MSTFRNPKTLKASLSPKSKATILFKTKSSLRCSQCFHRLVTDLPTCSGYESWFGSGFMTFNGDGSIELLGRSKLRGSKRALQSLGWMWMGITKNYKAFKPDTNRTGRQHTVLVPCGLKMGNHTRAWIPIGNKKLGPFGPGFLGLHSIWRLLVKFGVTQIAKLPWCAGTGYMMHHSARWLGEYMWFHGHLPWFFWTTWLSVLPLAIDTDIHVKLA